MMIREQVVNRVWKTVDVSDDRVLVMLVINSIDIFVMLL